MSRPLTFVEQHWASDLASASRDLTISRNEDTISAHAIDAKTGKVHGLFAETPIWSFRLSNLIPLLVFGIEKPVLSVFFVFTRYRHGFPKAVVISVRVDWPYDAKTVGSTKDRQEWYVVFQPPSAQLLLKLPGVKMSGKVRFAIPVNSGKRKFLRLNPKRKEMTPKRIAAYLLQYAVSISSLKKMRRPQTWHGFTRDNTLRPTPETVTTVVPYWTEDYQTAYHDNTSGRVTETFYRSYTGVRTPGYRFLRKSNLPVNNYHQVTRKTKNAMGFFVRERLSPPGDWYAYGGPTVDQFAGAPASAWHSTSGYNKALSKVIESSQGDINNIAQDFGQHGQTTKLIADTARRISRSVQALKAGNFPGAVHHLWHGRNHHLKPGSLKSTKSLAENWLELQYGWKPLLQDIDGSMKSLANYFAGNNLVRTVRGASRVTERYLDDINLGGFGNVLKVGRRESLLITHTRFGLRFRTDDHLKAFFAQTGFTNPVNLAWEVLPYSFVVDWFVPIGPYLSALSAWDGVTFVDGYLVQFSRLNTSDRIDYKGPWSQFPGYEVTCKGRFDREDILFDRTKLTALPSPRIPVFKNPISVTHVLNALALLRASFG